MVLKQVCTHGVVSFGLPVISSNGSIPRDTGPPFIAVNWYPFRTYSSSSYNKGRVYYRSTTSGIITAFITNDAPDDIQTVISHHVFDNYLITAPNVDRFRR